MDYWGQQIAIVCELCGGWHDTHQCANFQSQQHPFSNTYQPDITSHPNFCWNNNQHDMQQAQPPYSPIQNQPPYSIQNQQYGAWPYESSEMQHAYEPSHSFQNQQYDAWPYDHSGFQQQQEQQFQPHEFQQQQFYTDYGQQSNEEAEIDELRLMIKSLAESQKTLNDQFGQIANALLAEQEAQEAEQRKRDIDSAIALLLAQPRSIEAQPETSVGEPEQEAEMEAEKEAEPEASHPENSEHSVLKNQPQPPPLQSENSENSVQIQEKANAQVAMQFPSEDEESFRMEVVNTRPSMDFAQLLKSDPLESALQEKSDIEDEGIEEQVKLLNSAPWQGSFNNPHESLGVEDLWNSLVRLKSSYEEAPKFELKPLPDPLRYAYVSESSTLPIIIVANLSGSEEDKLLRILGEFKSAIGWTIADIKGISTSDCMLKILLEQGSKPTMDHQGRLYPIMEEGVKEEIIKWPMYGAHSKRMLQLIDLEEFCHQAYENSKLYKEPVKRWHDRHLAYKALHPP